MKVHEASDWCIEVVKNSLVGYLGDAHFDRFALMNHGKASAIIRWDGYRRLTTIEHLLEAIISRRVPGDLVEAGVFKGGVGILMQAILRKHKLDQIRRVWNFDSFNGYPHVNVSRYPQDEEWKDVWFEEKFWDQGFINTSLKQVKDNFATHGMLNGNVHFVQGWFAHTLPRAEVNRIAFLHIDADLYSSITQALEYLYPKLSPGGVVLLDDFKFPASYLAIAGFRQRYGIKTKWRFAETLDPIMYWFKDDDS